MKKILFSLFFMGFCLSLSLAQKAELSPCGSQPYKTEWLKNYQKDPSKFETRSGSTLYVPMTVHVLAGGVTDEFIFRNLCQLNADFQDTEIQFYLNYPIRRVSNGAYNSHQELELGYNMMVEYNVENTINTYVVDNPAGNCGYNLPYAGIAMNKTCMSEGDHTWAHEVGHNLSIQHPFLGWEGGVSYTGTVPHNFNNPAPDFVTYDYTLFQQTPYFDVDTLIVDTAFVERADGSNCHYAGDGFCDTDPDYIANRWFCNSDGQSNLIFTDPDGVKLQADASLIMSYADDGCAARFTEEQSAAMRANLIDEKMEYLDPNYTADPMLDPELVLNYPIDDEIVPFDGVVLDWEDIPNADFYNIEIYITNEVFPGMMFPWNSYSSQESEFTLPALDVNVQFFWEITPYEDFAFCNENVSEMNSFITSDVSSVNELDDTQVKLFPNILEAGQIIQIVLEETKDIFLDIRSMDGKQIYSYKGIGNQVSVSSQGWATGIYLAYIELEEGRTTRKIIVH